MSFADCAKVIGAGLALALTVACGSPEPAETSGADDPAPPTATITLPGDSEAPSGSLPIKNYETCTAFDRVISARVGSYPFTTLPATFTIKPGMSCGRADLKLLVGPDRVPTTFSTFRCTYYESAGATDAAATTAAEAAWDDVRNDLASCFDGRWELMGGMELMADGGTERFFTADRPPVAPRIKVRDGEVSSVQFIWQSSPAGERVDFIVIAR